MTTYQLLLTKNIPLSQLLPSQMSSGLLCSIVGPHMICSQLTYMYMIENEDDVRPMGVLGTAIEYFSCWS
jgi:hypothetical protein